MTRANNITLVKTIKRKGLLSAKEESGHTLSPSNSTQLSLCLSRSCPSWATHKFLRGPFESLAPIFTCSQSSKPFLFLCQPSSPSFPGTACFLQRPRSPYSTSLCGAPLAQIHCLLHAECTPTAWTLTSHLLMRLFWLPLPWKTQDSHCRYHNTANILLYFHESTCSLMLPKKKNFSIILKT